MRCRFKPEPLFVAGKIFLQEHIVNQETGYSEVKDVDQCAVLPDPSKYKLQSLLKEGVPLQETNCKLLNPKGTVKLGAVKKEESHEE